MGTRGMACSVKCYLKSVRARSIIAPVKALYPVIALLFALAQVPDTQAAVCPAMSGDELRSCCCDHSPEPSPMTGCCSSDTDHTENTSHAGCSCAWASASPDSEAAVSIAPNLPRGKLPTQHLPDTAPVIMTLDAEDLIARDHHPPGDTRSGDSRSSTHAPVFLLLCSILR